LEGFLIFLYSVLKRFKALISHYFKRPIVSIPKNRFKNRIKKVKNSYFCIINSKDYINVIQKSKK